PRQKAYRMAYDPEVLHAALAPRPVRYLPRVSSTNDVALDWLRQGAPPSAAVVADEQVSGRGRLGRHWHAPGGTALIVSALLHPPAVAAGRLTMVGAVAMCDLIASLGGDRVDIKWPNDV